MGMDTPWGALAGAGVQYLANEQGARAAKDAAKKAAKINQQNVDRWEGINAPQLKDLITNYEDYKYEGDVTPEMEQTLQQGGTEFDKINVDPQLKAAQMAALGKMQEVGDGGGLTGVDKAAYNKSFNENDNRAKGQRDAQLQSMRSRGVSGGGMELAAELANQGQSTQNNYNASLDINAQAQQRALQAMSQAGSMAGNIRSQDYGEQSNRASAQDQINNFNTQNAQGVQHNNVGATNTAAYANRDARQQVGNNNTGVHNTQQDQHVQAQQNNFNNNVTKTTGVTNAATGQANAFQNQATQEQNKWTKYGEVTAGVANKVYDTYQSNKHDENMRSKYPNTYKNLKDE